jgi:sugar phosphate isomerase/epimerase
VTIHQVAAQLYTVRDHTKTLPDFVATLRKLRDIGYEAVQLSAIGPFSETDIVKALNDEGVTACATHEPGAMILDEPRKVVDRLEALGCRYTAFPHPGDVPVNTPAEVRALAARLDAAGKVLFDAGKILCYHNHNIEFRRLDGRLMLDVLYDDTDPRHLQGELDTYWVQYGGGDPVEWCQRLEGRLPLLHLKDYITRADNKPDYAEIGEGNLDWPRIIAAAEESGCEWYIVEQDTCPGDPFDSLATSFDYIQQNLTG